MFTIEMSKNHSSFMQVWFTGNSNQMSHHMTKPEKLPVHPAKTQINLGINPVWSVFAVCMKKHWALNYLLSAQGRLWSDWMDVQADLSLRWVHLSFYWFCHAVAQMLQ